MIGDNVEADIFGGNQAGMTTILVHKGYSKEADYCLNDLYLVFDILKKSLAFY